MYEHFSALPKTWHYPKSYMPHIKRYSVMDRFHISELCYGRAIRGGTNLTKQGVRWVEAHLAIVGSVSVVITLSDAFLKSQWEKHVVQGSRQEMFTLDQVLAVNQQYRTLQDYNPEAIVDFRYELECEEDYLGGHDDIQDQILMEWADRLTGCMLYSGDHSGGFHNEVAKA